MIIVVISSDSYLREFECIGVQKKLGSKKYRCLVSQYLPRQILLRGREEGGLEEN